MIILVFQKIMFKGEIKKGHINAPNLKTGDFYEKVKKNIVSALCALFVYFFTAYY